MTKPEKIALLEEWRATITSADKAFCKLLEPMMVNPESPLYATLGAMQTAYTKAVAKLVGDRFEWLEWFCSENAMGKNGLEACFSADQPERSIKTINDLVKMIEGSQ